MLEASCSGLVNWGGYGSYSFILAEEPGKLNYAEDNTIKSPKKLSHYLVVDTETTGIPANFNSPITDLDNWPRIVQMAWMAIDVDGNLISEKQYIVRPKGFEIPESATAIHNISHDFALQNGQEIEYVLRDFISEIQSVEYIIGHNLEFDIKVIESELFREGVCDPFLDKTKVCTMKESTDFCAIPGNKGYKWPSLNELHLKIFSEEIEGAHSALVDVRATANCFWELLNQEIIILGPF